MSLDFFRRVFLGMSGPPPRFRDGDSLPKLESKESLEGFGAFGLSVESLFEFLEDLLCLVLSDFSFVGESTEPPAEWRLDDFGNSGKSLAVELFEPRAFLRLGSTP